MTVHIVRLGSPRLPLEGPRLGTVRRPPRGVAKVDYTRLNWYDVWLPELAPQADTIKLVLHGSDSKDWARFVRSYRAEMKRPAAARLLTLLATLSHTSDFSVGCYCASESRCHRSILRELLREAGARLP
jgi:uncharacterized protein YeaO (DUF488 family)